jgi:hypothetical protein
MLGPEERGRRQMEAVEVVSECHASNLLVSEYCRKIRVHYVDLWTVDAQRQEIHFAFSLSNVFVIIYVSFRCVE